jgi:hypothetical protein
MTAGTAPTHAVAQSGKPSAVSEMPLELEIGPHILREVK